MMNAPELIEGVQWTIDYYNDYDLAEVQAFIGGLGTGDQHGFVTNKLAMLVLDMSFLDLISQYRPEMNFGVTKIPSFEGDPTVSMAGSWWLGMPRGAQHPERPGLSCSSTCKRIYNLKRLPRAMIPSFRQTSMQLTIPRSFPSH